jgi:methylglyoxal reductase
MINKIGLGTWQFGKQFWGDVKDSESIAVLEKAIESDINFIDTAPIYGNGHSEEIVGQVIKKYRDKLFLATKCGLLLTSKGYVHNFQEKSLEKELYNSLKRLQTDYIDLYQIHWPSSEYSTDKALETLHKFKDKQLIKHIGVCNLSLEELSSLKHLPELYSLQTPYSLLTTEKEKNLLEFCKLNKLKTITYGNLLGGLLLDKYSSPEEIPQKSAKNIFYNGKNKEIWQKVQTIISEQKKLAKENNRRLAKQVLLETISQSEATISLVGCRTTKQLKDYLQ